MADDWSEGTARSTRRSRPPVSQTFSPSFELRVLDGPDAGRSLALEPGSVLLVGTSKLCAFQLADATVAPRHFSVEMMGSAIRLLDLSPEKETRVNGVCAHEAFLAGGEIVRIGVTAIAVRRRQDDATSVQTSFGRIHGQCAQMRALYNMLPRLARSREPLVIRGERGTGKRLLAEELHANAPWRDGPFVVAPRDAELEPFFEEARGGTLYIEEATSLAVLTGLIVPSDVRIIFGTRTSFDGVVERVNLPPLREREGDVDVLARHFWAQEGGASGSREESDAERAAFPDDFVARFHEHAWLGNVRELWFAVRDRLRHGLDETISDVVEIIGSRSSSPPPPNVLDDVIESSLPFVQARQEVMAEFERRYVDHALEKSGHNVARAAAKSGIAHRYFQVLKSRRKNA